MPRDFCVRQHHHLQYLSLKEEWGRAGIKRERKTKKHNYMHILHVYQYPSPGGLCVRISEALGLPRLALGIPSSSSSDLFDLDLVLRTFSINFFSLHHGWEKGQKEKRERSNKYIKVETIMQSQ